MAANFQVKVVGLEPFGKKVAKRIAKLSNMHPVYKKAVVLYFQWVQRNWNAAGGLHENSSLKWDELADSTIVRRRKKGKGAEILKDTGNLRRDWDLLSNRSRGIVRSQHFYSVFHEEGGKNNRPPQRKIFPETDQAYKIVYPAFEAHLKWGP